MHSPQHAQYIIGLLYDYGLLQFGQFFDESGNATPLRLNLHILPAYPAVLKRLVEAVVDALSSHVDRLVCPADSVPLAVTSAVKTGIPLVYSQGSAHAPAFDLIGAYDVGHPAALLINTLESADDVRHLIGACSRVGLRVKTTVSVVTLQEIDLPGIDVFSLVPLTGMLDYLVDSNRLPVGQAALVARYLERI
jgi:hypothetical protein